MKRSERAEAQWQIDRARDHLAAAVAILCDPYQRNANGLGHALVLCSLAMVRIAKADPDESARKRSEALICAMVAPNEEGDDDAEVSDR